MDNQKYETLINLIINEDQDQARDLFHQIVVEKSREIYESIMDEEMSEDMGQGMGGQVGDLLDEINAEESGVNEEDDIEFDDEAEEDGKEFTHDLEDEHDDEPEEGEDAVVRIEDKLDQLMAEFEQIMGGGADDMGGEDMGADDMGGEEGVAPMPGEDEEAMMEAINLQKVSVTHGDNGVQTRSPGLNNSGQAGMDSKPVKFSGASEAVPTGPKGASNAYSKGETSVPGSGSFKNVPAKNNANLGKAPTPVKSQASGVNTKSPVAR